MASHPIRPWLGRGVLAVLAVVVFAVNLRLYTPISGPATHDDVASHLSYLRGQLDGGLAEDMQQQFPEGYFFSYVLYGLTWVNVADGDVEPDLRAKALAEARFAMDALDSSPGRAPFSPGLVPAYGAFYVGWSNLLRAGILRLQSTPAPAELDALFDACDEILAALAVADTPFLASYPGQVWPVDMYPAMVSVRACAEFAEVSTSSQRYVDEIDRWLDEVDETINPSEGLVRHRTEPYVEHPRATSQTLILRFLADLDPERARLGYERFRQDHRVSPFGLAGIREHPPGIDRGGDVDSGPLVRGVSLSASVVAIGTAEVNGDGDLARRLRQQGAAFGFPIWLPGGKRYVAGLLPIGDLFVVWASTDHRWFESPAEPLPSDLPWWWRLPTHALSLALAGGVGLLVVRRRKGRVDLDVDFEATGSEGGAAGPGAADIPDQRTGSSGSVETPMA